MKKSWLFLVCLFASLSCFSQQKSPKTTTTLQEKSKESNLFYLGGKPAAAKECYRFNDFKQKIDIETPPSDVDSIKFQLYLISGLRPVASKELSSLKELQTFDFYGWLMGNNVKGTNETRYETTDEQGKTFVYKARPGDRLLIEMTFLWNGKKGVEYKNFVLCK